MSNTADVLHLRDQGSQSALRAAVLTAWGKVDAGEAVLDVIYEADHCRRNIGYKNAFFEFANLLREICGNPFRPVTLNSIWLTPTVTNLATAAYDERIMPSGELDPARLAVLSDALEEAGCDNEDILGHLRGPGPHVRGCWAVDLVLGKE